jgi:Mg2+ and Co2+ transporter CorA
MITNLSTTENKLRTLPQVADGAWVNVINPSAVEIEETYGMGIPLNFITDSLDTSARPHIKKEAGTTLILLQVPYDQGNDIRTVPLGIILCYDDIITISKFEVPFIEQLIHKNGQYFTSNNRRRILSSIFRAIEKQYTKATKTANMITDNVNNQKSVELLSRNMKADKKVFELIKDL